MVAKLRQRLKESYLPRGFDTVTGFVALHFFVVAFALFAASVFSNPKQFSSSPYDVHVVPGDVQWKLSVMTALLLVAMPLSMLLTCYVRLFRNPPRDR